MPMKKVRYKNNLSFQWVVVLFLFVLVVYVHRVISCGGGVVPYVPTYVPTASDAGASTTTGQFFLDIEKGVIRDMFEVKKLNPVFRTVILSGNERRTYSKNALKKQDVKSQESSEKDSTEYNEAYADTTGEGQVINLFRLH